MISFHVCGGYRGSPLVVLPMMLMFMRFMNGGS